jgi:hypothetical protein
MEGHQALMDRDGEARLFAELVADPDRPEVRPQEAYRALLASVQPGRAVRMLQIFWPDPQPRQAFIEQARTWENGAGKNGGEGEEEGVMLLHQGLLLFAQEAPLPFSRRTILEFVLPNKEDIAWWEGLPGLLQPYGIHVRLLSPDEIQELAHWIFNPELR